MNLAKVSLLVVFTWFATASNFALASVVYSYAGNNFNSFQENTADAFVYDTSMSITGTVELATALAVDATTTVSPTSYSFLDGNQELTDTSAGIIATFTFTTDIIGEIINWNVKLQIPLPGTPVFGNKDLTIHTQNEALFVRDIGSISTVTTVVGPPINTYSSSTDSGEVLNPGVWTEVSAVPLPATVWLFGSGLLGLFGLAKRKEQFAG